MRHSLLMPFLTISVEFLLLLSMLKPYSAFRLKVKNMKLANEMPHQTFNICSSTDKEAKMETTAIAQRRALLLSVAKGVLMTLVGSTSRSLIASAEVIDETETYANMLPDSAYAPPSSRMQQQQQADIITDEISFTFTPEEIMEWQSSLGIELADISFKTNSRVYVRSVRPQSIAEKKGVKPNFIVVAVNGQSTERTNAAGVSLMVKQAISDTTQSIQIVFRDPSIFSNAITNLQPNQSASTQVAPAGETSVIFNDDVYKSPNTQTDQVITVTQLIAPPKRKCVEANTGDLLEIIYTASAVVNDEVTSLVDGSTISVNGKGIPGRGGDLSLFFVLGKQPAGQFPPGWDVGLKGMCIGERRRILIPPVL
jgi:FK506-binding protein 2